MSGYRWWSTLHHVHALEFQVSLEVWHNISRLKKLCLVCSPTVQLPVLCDIVKPLNILLYKIHYNLKFASLNYYVQNTFWRHILNTNYTSPYYAFMCALWFLVNLCIGGTETFFSRWYIVSKSIRACIACLYLGIWTMKTLQFLVFLNVGLDEVFKCFIGQCKDCTSCYYGVFLAQTVLTTLAILKRAILGARGALIHWFKNFTHSLSALPIHHSRAALFSGLNSPCNYQDGGVMLVHSVVVIKLPPVLEHGNPH